MTPPSGLPFKNKPTFFVIGAQRAGTTRLCHLLDRHPDVAIPTKEPFYFQTEDSMRSKCDWYRTLFEEAQDASIFGEGSTYYSMCDTYPGTAGRIFEFEPGARIIYMIRHPLRRIESAWYQLLSTREISGLKTFKEAVLESDRLIEPTLYWRQLSEYRRHFPDGQIFMGLFEDFVQDEQRVVRSCLEFLGMEDRPLSDSGLEEGRNQSAQKEQPWRVVDLVKSVPGYASIKRVVPEKLRIVLGERMTKPIRAVPEWDSELLDYVVERVGSDCRSVLDYVGKPHSAWGL